MKAQELKRLQRGDIVRSKVTGESFIVIDRGHGGEVIAIRDVTITNLREWEIVTQHDWSKRK